MRSLLLVGAAIALGCAQDAELRPREPIIVDRRDGAEYAVVRIGRQDWLGRDLSWNAPGSHCRAHDDCVGAGRLYKWSSAVNACPPGWSLPSDADWQELEAALGMPAGELAAEGFRGTDQGGRLRAGGETGFDAPLTGYLRPNGEYVRQGERSAYWLSTPAGEGSAWHRDLRRDDGRIYRSAVPRDYALSVRCLRSRMK